MNLTLTPEQVVGIQHLARPGAFHEKFFHEPQEWVMRAFNRLLDIGLQRGSQKRWILDVGCGVPYFAWVAEKYGHDVMNLDLPEPTLKQAADVLGAEYLPHVISIERPLPRLPHRLDMVTVFGVNLAHPGGQSYSPVEYAGVLRAAFDQLVPGGRLVVGPNYGYLGDVWKHIAWWQEFFPAGLAEIETRRGVVVV